MCAQLIENVYWPTGTAPTDIYTFWVHTNSLLPSEVPVPFELQLLRGTDVVWRHTGTPLLYDTAAGRNAAPVPGPPLEVYPTIRCPTRPPKELLNKPVP